MMGCGNCSAPICSHHNSDKISKNSYRFKRTRPRENHIMPSRTRKRDADVKQSNISLEDKGVIVRVQKKSKKTVDQAAHRQSENLRDGIPKWRLWKAAYRIKKALFPEVHWDIDNFKSEDNKEVYDGLNGIFTLIDECEEFKVPLSDPNRPKRTCAYRVVSLVFNLRDREELPKALTTLIRSKYPSNAYVGFQEA